MPKTKQECIEDFLKDGDVKEVKFPEDLKRGKTPFYCVYENGFKLDSKKMALNVLYVCQCNQAYYGAVKIAEGCIKVCGISDIMQFKVA